jgi:adenylate kinase
MKISYRKSRANQPHVLTLAKLCNIYGELDRARVLTCADIGNSVPLAHRTLAAFANLLDLIMMDGAFETVTRPINMILLGPPGAGKGTQARMLEEEFGLVQLSTGDLLRDAVAANTDAGRAAKAVMDAGDLVSDHIVVAILNDRLDQPDIIKGTILDGFPRTQAQAHALDTMLAERGQQIDAVVSLEVDDDAMVARVAGRYTCSGCGEGYHDTFKKPQINAICDKCKGARFKRRPDDNADTVRTRLSTYHAQTAPLISYYDDKKTLTKVPAMGSINAIATKLSDLTAQVLAVEG